MTVVGKMRFLDAEQVQRGRVEVSVEDGTVTLLSERDGNVHRMHVDAAAALKIAAHLERAAAVAQGEP